MRNLFKVLVTTLALSLTSIAAAEAVNINTADAASISKALTGVGIKKAEAIVEYRKAHGPFKSADDLNGVKGIGKATIEKNRTSILVK